MISIHGLDKAFRVGFLRRRFPVLAGLDFEMPAGETVGIIGPNGTGKSTLLKILFHLLHADAGDIRIFGLPPWDATWHDRTGYLPEVFWPPPYIKGKNFLQMTGAIRGMTPSAVSRRIEELADPLDLPPLLDKKVGKNSRGMAQRLGVAHALLHDPELLIMDEPTANLDPVARKRVRDLLRVRRGQGKSLLICSHLLSEVEEIVDRVVFMRDGVFRQDIRISELVGVGWMVKFRLPAAVPALPGSGPLAAGEYEVTAATDEEKNQLVRAVVEAGGDILGLSRPRRSLENQFMEWVR